MSSPEQNQGLWRLLSPEQMLTLMQDDQSCEYLFKNCEFS